MGSNPKIFGLGLSHVSSYQPRPEAVSEKGSPRSAVDPDVALAAMDFFRVDV